MPKFALLIVLTFAFFVAQASDQPVSNCANSERFTSGPYSGFVRENPELNKTELPKAITVASVRGAITQTNGVPVGGAAFEIRNERGQVFSACTDTSGRFHFDKVSDGQYDFKATLNGFHSVIGRLVVKRNVGNGSIHIQLQLGT